MKAIITRVCVFHRWFSIQNKAGRRENDFTDHGHGCFIALHFAPSFFSAIRSAPLRSPPPPTHL
jgi:hypothetical protein